MFESGKSRKRCMAEVKAVNAREMALTHITKKERAGQLIMLEKVSMAVESTGWEL